MKPYQVPSGYHDSPWLNVFDGTLLTNGTSPGNLSINQTGGVGEFLLRRILGVENLANPNGTGTFHVRDENQAYLENDPVAIGGQYDRIVLPERRYRENAKIVFDLQNVLKATNGSAQLIPQIGFWGSRRKKGNLPPARRFKPKSYEYVFEANVTVPIGATQSFFLQIANYDFELHQIGIQQVMNAGLSLNGADEAKPPGDALNFFINALTPGLSPVTFQWGWNVLPNQPLSITVTGNAIRVFFKTDGLSTPSNQFMAPLAAGMLANPAVTALVKVTVPANLDPNSQPAAIFGSNVNAPVQLGTGDDKRNHHPLRDRLPSADRFPGLNPDRLRPRKNKPIEHPGVGYLLERLRALRERRDRPAASVPAERHVSD